MGVRKQHPEDEDLTRGLGRPSPSEDRPIRGIAQEHVAEDRGLLQEEVENESVVGWQDGEQPIQAREEKRPQWEITDRRQCLIEEGKTQPRNRVHERVGTDSAGHIHGISDPDLGIVGVPRPKGERLPARARSRGSLRASSPTAESESCYSTGCQTGSYRRCNTRSRAASMTAHVSRGMITSSNARTRAGCERIWPAVTLIAKAGSFVSSFAKVFGDRPKRASTWLWPLRILRRCRSSPCKDLGIATETRASGQKRTEIPRSDARAPM